MKLNAVSCTQFAGLRDTNVTFQDGINVIYGKNESGKSTLVNLIARTLFQNARIDGRSDKEFRDLYYPSSLKGRRTKGDYADGKLTFCTELGTYTLSKEWCADARCILSAPEGVIRDPKTIDTLLREALVYGEGVYTQLLFSSQRGSDQALKTLLDASVKTDAKQDIVDAVTMAMAESDGVSVDAIEQAINAKIDELIGKHWDVELSRPARKTGRWSAGLGEILKAYYALEDAQTVLSEIEALEQEADRTSASCAKLDAEVLAAEKAFDEFRGFAASLTVRSERQDKIRRLEAELTHLREVLSRWPDLQMALEKACALHAEQQACVALERYHTIRALVEEKQALAQTLSQSACPTAQEIAAVRNAQRRIQVLQNTLCGMNLAAVIRMFGDHTVEIRSLRTGEMLDITDGNAAITEAVSIVVPGVMDMQLAPADVDTVAVTAELEAQQAIVGDTFTKFAVTSLEALEELAVRAQATQRSLEALDSKITMLLGEESFEDLQTAASVNTENVRSQEAIDADIHLLCEGDVVRFITVTETKLKGYETEFGSLDSLKAKAFDVTTALDRAKSTVEAADAIPEAYLTIRDPEAHLEQLQVTLRDAQRRREEALAAKTVAAGKLEGYKERLEEDPKEACDAAARRLQEQKDLLDHWMHIRDVFLAQKECLGGNPMVDVAKRFAHNLQVLSEGGVDSEFPESDRLNMVLYSRDREIDFTKLSEGTKETVSLAFRLAMLDHLFPDGGVIVLDDPFANMDADRTKRSCALLQDCATRHQVLFLTCKKEFPEMLGGNVINL